MRTILFTLVCLVIVMAAVAPVLSNPGADRPTPYVTSLSNAGMAAHQVALPRSCKETRCSQQAPYVCIKVNSAPWACKVGQGKTSCTEDPC